MNVITVYRPVCYDIYFLAIFSQIDRPDVMDEGPSVLTRAQMKRHAQVVLEARTRKVRPPTARDLRKTRRRSTVVDRSLQAMS